MRGCFDVLYREEKLAALGLSVPQKEEGEGGEAVAGEGAADAGAGPAEGAAAAEPRWSGDEGRGGAGTESYERDWRKDHDETTGAERAARRKKGPARGGKGGVGMGEAGPDAFLYPRFTPRYPPLISPLYPPYTPI